VIERLARASPHVLAGSLCGGLAAANLLRAGRPVVAGLAVLAAAIAVFDVGLARFACLAAALALAGLWWGSVRLDALDRSVLTPRIGETVRVQAAVTGPARRSRFSVRVPAQVRGLDRLKLREAVLLELPHGRSPPQGAVIETVAKIERPRPPEDGFDEAGYLRRRGVHVVLKGGTWREIGRRGGIAGLADRLRARIARTLAPGLGGERRAVLAGVVLGEDEGLSEQLRDDFRASGLYHLLAVSGQNVVLVAGGMLGLAWLVGLPRWLGELGALAAIAGYAAAVGWQPSVVRAGVAGSLASLAWLAARSRDRWYCLLAGACVLLAWNPYSLLEPGFQLSFSAVGAIFVAVPALGRRLEGYPVPVGLADVLAVSAACGVVTAPILWLHFGAVPLYTVPANVLAWPAMAPLLGIALACTAVDPVSPQLAEALAWANGWLAAYVAACARTIGGLPGAQATSPTIVVGVAVVAFSAVALPRLRRPRVTRAVALALLSAAVPAAAWLFWPGGGPPPPPPHGLRITALDVGQGDSILLQVPQGNVLVDEGPPEANVAAQLKRLGVRRLAAIVLTHPQRDHVGGAATILARMRVDAVLDPRIPFESPFERAALREARRKRVSVVTVEAGRTFRLGRLTLRVLWPPQPVPPGDDPNNWATVIHARYGQVDALLTADAESNVTFPIHPPQVEVLKVAHHGSADAGLQQLLDAVRPRVALISVGAGNDYGHPTASTLATLAARSGLEVYRTDLDGAIAVDSDGRRLEVRTSR
jgi:competence protein ComEC